MPGQFDESKHPRDGGKFSSKPGSGGEKKEDNTKVKDMGDVNLKKEKPGASFGDKDQGKREKGFDSHFDDLISKSKDPKQIEALKKLKFNKEPKTAKPKKSNAELGDKMMRRLNTDDAGAKASSGYAGVAKKPLDTAQHNFFTKQIGRLEKISQRLDRAVASGNYDKLQLALDKNEEMGKISRNFSGINILSEGSLDRDTMNRLEDVIRSTGNHMGNSTWDGQGDHEYYKKVAVDNANKLHQVLDTLSGKQKSSDALYGEMWSGSMSNINTKMNTLKLASMKLQVKS